MLEVAVQTQEKGSRQDTPGGWPAGMLYVTATSGAFQTNGTGEKSHSCAGAQRPGPVRPTWGAAYKVQVPGPQIQIC